MFDNVPCLVKCEGNLSMAIFGQLIVVYDYQNRFPIVRVGLMCSVGKERIIKGTIRSRKKYIASKLRIKDKHNRFLKKAA